MIDRVSRNRVADEIKLYFSKCITAPIFVDEYLLVGVRSKDKGLKSISQDAAVFFCDMNGYSEEEQITEEALHVIKFLHSDDEILQEMT